MSGLQITTFQLDQRVGTLEENAGDDGNSSVAELEVRVETLETTVSDQDARINATETGLEGILPPANDVAGRLGFHRSV